MGSSQQQTCAKCGKPKETADQASLTQWISACTCDQLELNNEEFESVQMCLRCMKRINPGRSGSLTQWVFRSDICNCDMPQPSAEEVLVAKSTKLPKRQGTAELDRDIYEREISVDARTFPLNRYKPLVVLGAGAFGQVYLCRDRLLNKKVAVKTIKNVHGSQLPDFQKEAKATSKLNHPGIVKVMDFGATESGAPFMVLDYVPGITLASYISAHGSLSPETTLQFALQLCEALAYAHKHSIFHRDIKPSNILLPQQADRQSIVQIIDFGIAKVRQPQDQTSQFLTIAGTPPYMSPDQFEGYRYDARSEIYSLGCVMFECLAGRPPYVGTSVQEVLAMHKNDEIPEVRSFCKGASAELSAVISRCLAKNPEERYSSMEELRQALLSTAPEPVIMRTSSQKTIAPSELKPKVNFVPMVVSGLILTVLSASVVLYLLNRNEVPPQEVHRSKAKKLNVNPQAEFASHFQQEQKDGVTWTTPIDLANLTDEDLHLLQHREIKAIDLSSSKIDGSGLRYLSKCGVQSLDLSQTSLKPENFWFISTLPELRDIALTGTNTSLKELKQISNLKLKTLNLSGCASINGECLQYVVETWPSLVAFQIGFCDNVKGSDLRTLAQLTGLHFVSVAFLNAEKDDFAALAGLPLTDINVDGSNINDDGLLKFAKSKTMRVISLKGCKLVSEHAIARFKQIAPRIRLETTTASPTGSDPLKQIME